MFISLSFSLGPRDRGANFNWHFTKIYLKRGHLLQPSFIVHVLPHLSDNHYHGDACAEIGRRSQDTEECAISASVLYSFNPASTRKPNKIKDRLSKFPTILSTAADCQQNGCRSRAFILKGLKVETR